MGTMTRDSRFLGAPFHAMVFLAATACGATLNVGLLSKNASSDASATSAAADDGSRDSMAPMPQPSSRARLASYIFPNDSVALAACEANESDQDLVSCLLASRFAEDAESLALARRIHAERGIVVGVEVSRVMDDGDYRGPVHIEPALPIGSRRQHLAWVLEAFELLETAFEAFAPRAPAPPEFVRKPIAIRFYETTNTTTPSAYAEDGVIAYNLRGELWTSVESALETLVHELFHLTDASHDRWSESVLRETYESIQRRCGGDQECLAPFAPHETKVDGGIFYAFHPTSDVREYAAELAARFVREQRRWLSGGDIDTTPFKCASAENEKAWRSLSRDFFGGLDLVPDC